jgi:two-component system NtrC family sensor kinase
MLLDEQTHELAFKVSLGPGAEQAKEMRLAVNQGIAGWVAREGQPALVLDVRTDPRWYPDVDSHTGFVTQSILAVPLESKEKVIGVIEAINKVHGAFSAGDLQLLNSVSMVVTTAIENARLFGELSTAYQETTQSRAQILESRNTLRAIFDGINDSICIIDQNLEIKAINRAAAMIQGEEPQNLIGRNCHTVLCQSNGLCDDCPVTRAFRTGEPTSSIDRRIQKQGATRELEISTYPLKDAAGVVDRVIYIAQDVTEEHKMEATLLQSARLSAVGELAAGITHEIGNPLTAVIGNVQMLLEALEPSDPCYKMAQLIERAGLRMEKLVNNLLKFSRQEGYYFEPTDLNASIEDALSLIVYQLERDNIHVTKEFQADLPLISTSASHLQTVWINLLLNARDAIPKGKTGRIQIATRISKDRRSIEVLFIDNGSGITPEALSRIFDPFFTTKPQGKGTGLGLYISNVVIAHHHGTLQVQSQEGKGSTFVVTLPFESEAQADDAELSAA